MDNPSSPSDYDYSLSSDHIKLIRNALQEEDQQTVQQVVERLHAADVADIIEQLNQTQRVQFIEILRPHFDPEILVELDEYIREEVVHLLSTKELASAISELQSDDAVAIFDDLEYDVQQHVLKEISEADRQSLESSLDYEEESAGRLMMREMIVAPLSWTVGQVIDIFEGTSDLPPDLSQVFVIDLKNCPVGAVSLGRLLQLPRRTPIETVMDKEIKIVSVSMTQADLAFYFHQYTLPAVPVVEKNGQLVGMITASQMISVIQEEAEKDLMGLGRVSEPAFTKPVVEISLKRLRWLIVTFINTLLASSVISHFEEVIQKVVALAVLMPIVASMGGNAGMQAVTVTVRALAQRDLRKGMVWRIVMKEMGVSFINSLFLATLLSSIAIGWYKDVKLGIILGAALIFNMVWSGLAGTLFPVVLDRLGFDPAIGSGPLLTTTTDVLGFLIFLGLATIFLF